MEPLIATDWLKDYDPLFDLFDEEMRCSSASQNGMGADYFSLEWMPCLDLNSPSTSSSSSLNSTAPLSNVNSQANSQCSLASPSSSSSTTSTTTTSSSSSSSSSPIITTTINNQQGPHNMQTNTTINNNNNTTNSTGQQEQRVFRIQLQNNVSSNKLGIGNSINNNSIANSSDLGQSPTINAGDSKQKSCLVVNSNNNLIASSLIDTTSQIVSCANVNLKRKKKCLKTKGTSLLAQPASKSANNSTSSLTAPTKTSNKMIMPTLITINRPSTMMTPLQQQQQQVLTTTTKLLSTTTTLTNKNNHTTPLTYIANGTASINNNNNNNNLTKLDRTIRYCIKIEHAYSSMMC